MKRNILCDLFYYRLLKCILDSCAGEPPCQNQGFMKYNGVCSCVCPEGLTGSDCTELDTSPGAALTVLNSFKMDLDTILYQNFIFYFLCTQCFTCTF